MLMQAIGIIILVVQWGFLAWLLYRAIKTAATEKDRCLERAGLYSQGIHPDTGEPLEK